MKLFFLLALFAPILCFSQNRVDLQDLDIKGELHKDNQFQFINRERYQLNENIEYRTDYRKEMAEGLPKPEPRLRFKMGKKR